MFWYHRAIEMQDPLYQVLLKSWLQAASTILVDEDDPSKGTVRIRVGLASGPVTATVMDTPCSINRWRPRTWDAATSPFTIKAG